MSGNRYLDDTDDGGFRVTVPDGSAAVEHAYPPEMDGATPSISLQDPGGIVGRSEAADPGLPLDERIEIYEDLIDSEVGDTLLTRARNIEREFGLRQLYLKFEGGNPTGSQKDRIAFAQCMDAIRRGYDTITVATCGNYGAAISLASSLAGLRCVVFIPESYHTRRLLEIERGGAEVVVVGRDYEQAVDRSREFAVAREAYDANPGGANTAIQLKAYGEIAYEVYDELRDAPAAVAVSVSNGTTLAGIHRGFLSLHRRGKTSRMPRFVAGSTFHKNPIVAAFLRNLDSCEDLPQEGIRETAVNEPLINWRAIDGDHALWALRETEGSAGHVADRKMMNLSRLLREREGLNVLPASTAGLQALLMCHGSSPLPPDRYVAVLTGRKQ